MARQNEPKIDKEFADFIPPVGKAEDDDLRKSLLNEGQRDKAVVWKETGILVDGHRRYKILKQLKKPFSYIVRSFPNRQAVLQWMALNQLARRNLTEMQISYFRGLEYLAAVEERTQAAPDETEAAGKTADLLAEQHGVSPSTIKRDGQLAKNLGSLPNKAEVLAGDTDATKQQIAAGAICKKCQRVGLVKDCPMCAELKAALKTGASVGGKGKSTKSGSVVFDWAAQDKVFGQYVRSLDLLPKAYPLLKGCSEHTEALRLCQRLAEINKGLRQSAAGV